MKPTFAITALAGSLLLAGGVAANERTEDYLNTLTELGYPAPKENQLVHIPPTMQDLEASDMHPELKRVIRRGYDLFTDTQQLRGENVFNNIAGYIEAQLKAWQAGTRKNDPQDLMGTIARRMSDEDIRAVAAWLSTQPPQSN